MDKPSNKPYLFLDVDGPINATATTTKALKWKYNRLFFCVDKSSNSFIKWTDVDDYKFYKRRTTRLGETSLDYRVYEFLLNPYVADNLASLSSDFDLAWATTWGDDANRALLDTLNLPRALPVVNFSGVRRYSLPKKPFWKTDAILDFANGRPFAWADDLATKVTADYVSDLSPKSTVLRVTSARGLVEKDFDYLRNYAASLRG